MYIDCLVEELERIEETKDTVIHLNYIGLNELPREILTNPAYQHIRRIYAKQNGIIKLPDDIGLLGNLVELYLNSNNLKELPDGIGRLENLQSLDLGNNQLTSLPRTIGNLQSLERIILSNNDLENLPPEIGLLTSLIVLEAMNNQLRSFPTEICVCEQLNRILLDRNRIQWLPQQICQMKSLEEISIAANLLLALPFDLGESDSLKRVYVDGNHFLHALPVSLYAQEIGFTSCGSHNFCPETSVPSIVIQHSEDFCKRIWLSAHLKRIGNQDDKFVPSLLELSMRSVYNNCREDLAADTLPSSLHAYVRQPLCLCHCCKQPIFREAYPVVFEGQIRLYSLYRVTLCCSWRCVRLAALIVQLPLIYPNPTHLHLAVALVN